MIRIPLRRVDGTIRAYALIDDVDAEQADFRWHLTTGGYVRRRIRIDGKAVLLGLHRAILDLPLSDPRMPDHINGDPLDNRRANLRVATRAENQQNRVVHKTSGNGYRGVHYHKFSGLWQARVKVNRQWHYAGYHKTAELAAEAAADLRLRLMPFTNEERTPTDHVANETVGVLYEKGA